VTLVYCGQTVGWIKMKLGTEVGLGPRHTVLDGDRAPPIFGPYPLLPNGWMHKAGTWYGGRPRPRRHCIRWRTSSPSPKTDTVALLHFSAHVYFGQTAGWIKMPLGMKEVLGPGDIVLDGDPAPLTPQTKKIRDTAPNFRPCLFCSLAFLDPRVGHTMDVLSPFISILCHSD